MSAASVDQAAPDKRRQVRRDRWWLFALALGLRLVVALYGASRFPPADDGAFYHAVARRIADGAGYTWAWPDGAVTYAAHYPVGYPALLGAAYALFGASPLVAMLLNALLGALLVVGVHELGRRVASPERARLAALLLAVHPTLVLYSAALMTELPAAAVLVLLAAYALWLGSAPRGVSARLAHGLGLGLGGAALVLIRPQLLPVVAVLGAVSLWLPETATSSAALWARARAAALVTLVSVAACLPWTLRNCARMDGCVFVSANGGWNLLIGTLPEGKGSFAPIAGPSVPVECREVFGEAGKDRCFGQAGARRIREQPLAWLSLAPQKLGQLFDHGAVASSYLHASNGALVGESLKLGLAAVETLYTRLLLLGACLGLLRSAERRSERWWALGALGFTLTPWGFLAELGVLGSIVAGRPGPGRRPLRFVAGALLGLCVVTHVVFFGAARYALVWLPWLPLLMAERGGGKSPVLRTGHLAQKGEPLRVF